MKNTTIHFLRAHFGTMKKAAQALGVNQRAMFRWYADGKDMVRVNILAEKVRLAKLVALVAKKDPSLVASCNSELPEDYRVNLDNLTPE